jgi:hypothetical protein
MRGQSLLSVRSWTVLALLACVAVLTSFPAHAGGNVSVGIGYWSGPGPGYYPYHHHHPRPYWGPRYRSSVVIYPAPVYYPPPRPVYYPAPVYPVPVPAPVVQATQQCMQYNGDAIVDGSGQPFYGRACLFTDSRWHIVP